MATRQKNRSKRPARNAEGKSSPLRAQNHRLERELKELRAENRQLKRRLGPLICRDLPVNMDLTQDDGVNEPSLTELIAELEHAAK